MLYQSLKNNHQLSAINKQPPTNKLMVINDSNKKVKNLLLQGWRQRWNPPEFAIYLKQQLSIISKSGDNYELSKLILQQATVGRQPVILFIDYLHHLLSCGVISFGSVINSIIETCKKENTQVVICLLDFLLNQGNNINCFSSEQDCLDLSTSLARLIKFIFNCLEFSLQRLNELITRQLTNQLNQHEQAIDKCTKLLSQFKDSKFMISLIFIGFIEENQIRNLKSINFSDVYEQLEKLSSKFQDNKLIQLCQQNLFDFLQTIHKFNPNLQTKKYLQFENDKFNYRKSSNLSIRNLKPDDKLITDYFNEQTDYLNKPLISLNCVVTFDAILNPKTPSTKLAYQIYRIAISNHLKFSIICCEFVKCSLVNFADSLDLEKDQDKLEIKFLNQFQRGILNSKQSNATNKENSRWASFIYLKLPLVLKSLKKLLKERNQTLDLEKGLEKLINYTPLLELIDYKTNCDSLKNLLNKFVAVQLIDEQFQLNLLKKRDEKVEYFNNLNCKVDKTVLKKQLENLVTIQGQILLESAEPTANSILSTLSPEIASKPENLLPIFSNLIGNTTFEIVTNALLYTGKLGKFIKRLIYFNEINSTSNEETSKQAILRYNLFDHSFLILNLIVQEHGQEAILNCLEEEGIDLNRHLNRSIQQTNNDEMDIDDQNSLVNSFFVRFCLDYLPENSSKVNYDDKFLKDLDSSKVDYLLGQFQSDNFDYQMIKWNEVLLNSIGAFKELLQSYLQDFIKFEELTNYLINMIKRNCSIGLVISFYAINQINKVALEQKRKIITILNFITNSSNFSFFFNNHQDVYLHYKEKYLLTSNLIKNLIKESIPKRIIDNQQLNLDDDKIELYKILKLIFLNTIKKGWLDTNSIYCFDKILCIGGSNWFMDKVIKILLYECELENLDEGVELIYGLSTLDIEQCCLSLLNIVIPQYLVNFNDQNVLIEPKLIALSKLISIILYSVLESDLNELKLDCSTVKRNSSYYIEDNFINYEDKLNDQLLNDNVHKLDTPIYYIKSADNAINNDSNKRKQLLLNSISRLLRLISSLLNKEKISQRTNFSLIILEQLIFKCTLTNNLIDYKFNPNLITNSIDKLISNDLNNNSQIILKYLPFDTILNLVRIFPEKLNFDLLISISNLQSTNSRKILAKSICQLHRSNYQSF